MKFLILVLIFISSSAFGQICLPDSGVLKFSDGLRFDTGRTSYHYDSTLRSYPSLRFQSAPQETVRIDTIPSMFLLANTRKHATNLVWWSRGYTIRKTTSRWFQSVTKDTYLKQNMKPFPSSFFVFNQIAYP